MLNYNGKVWMDGTEYERYVVKELVMDLHQPHVSMVVHYFDEDENRTYIKKHTFVVEGEEVDVNEMIRKTHRLHK
jgi:hypothetical protein